MFTFWVWGDGKNVWNPRVLQGQGYGRCSVLLQSITWGDAAQGSDDS